jgi:hypothetical protein
VSLLKRILVVAIFLALSACATVSPVPQGYSGPVATIRDSGISESSGKAQMFVVMAVDGVEVQNSLGASRSASSGQGFRLTTKFVDRQVFAKPQRLKLRGTHTTAAPIHALFSQLAGSFHSVDAEIDFTPEAGRVYVVRGELKQEGSSVWIEDEQSRQPVTPKLTGKPGTT